MNKRKKVKTKWNFRIKRWHTQSFNFLYLHSGTFVLTVWYCAETIFLRSYHPLFLSSHYSSPHLSSPLLWIILSYPIIFYFNFIISYFILWLPFISESIYLTYEWLSPSLLYSVPYRPYFQPYLLLSSHVFYLILHIISSLSSTNV